MRKKCCYLYACPTEFKKGKTTSVGLIFVACFQLLNTISVGFDSAIVMRIGHSPRHLENVPSSPQIVGSFWDLPAVHEYAPALVNNKPASVFGTVHLRLWSKEFCFLSFAIKPSPQLQKEDPILSQLWLPKNDLLERTNHRVSLARRHQERLCGIEETLIWIRDQLHRSHKERFGMIEYPACTKFWPLPSTYGYRNSHRDEASAQRQARLSQGAFTPLIAHVSYIVASTILKEIAEPEKAHSRGWDGELLEEIMKERLHVQQPQSRAARENYAKMKSFLQRSVLCDFTSSGLRVGTVLTPDCPWISLLPLLFQSSVPTYMQWGTPERVRAIKARPYPELPSQFPSWLHYYVPDEDAICQVVKDYQEMNPDATFPSSVKDSKTLEFPQHNSNNSRLSYRVDLKTEKSLIGRANKAIAAGSVRPIPTAGDKSRPSETPEQYFARRREASKAKAASETPAQSAVRQQKMQQMAAYSAPGEKSGIRVFRWEEDEGQWSRTLLSKAEVRDDWPPKEHLFFDYDANCWDIYTGYAPNAPDRPLTAYDYDDDDDDDGYFSAKFYPAPPALANAWPSRSPSDFLSDVPSSLSDDSPAPVDGAQLEYQRGTGLVRRLWDRFGLLSDESSGITVDKDKLATYLFTVMEAQKGWEKDLKEDVRGPVFQFFQKIVAPGATAADIHWDVVSLTHWRLRIVHRPQMGNDHFYQLTADGVDLSSTTSWLLFVRDPVVALMCRRAIQNIPTSEQINILEESVQLLVKFGAQFVTASPWKSEWGPPSENQREPVVEYIEAVAPDHQWDYVDYREYKERSERFLRSPRGVQALRCGGIVAFLASQVLGEYAATRPPCVESLAYAEFIKINDTVYFADRLSDKEMEFICGGGVVMWKRNGMTIQKIQYSFHPPPRLWDKLFGHNVWTQISQNKVNSVMTGLKSNPRPKKVRDWGKEFHKNRGEPELLKSMFRIAHEYIASL